MLGQPSDFQKMEPSIPGSYDLNILLIQSTVAPRGRVAQALTFARISKIGGAPFFAQFAKGGN